MRRSPAEPAALLIGLLLLARAVAADSKPTESVEPRGPGAGEFTSFARQFLAQRPDPSSSAHVEHLVLDRDAARLTLESGDLWLGESVKGRTCSAVFAGAGTFSFTPPNPFEQRELLRFYGTTSLDLRIKSMVLIFADSTDAEIRRQVTFRHQPASSDLAELLSACLGFYGDPRSADLDPQMISTFLNGNRDGYLFVFLWGEKGERLFFVIDPSQYEEVSLWRVPAARFLLVSDLGTREIICQFPRGGQYDSTARGVHRPDLTVGGYHIDGLVSSELGFSASAEMRCRIDRGGTRWVPLHLYGGLDVDSVYWDQGPASFARARGGSLLWVKCPESYERGEEHTLRVAYHGDLFHSVSDWILLKSSSGWYPRAPGATESTFDLTFRAPSEYHLRSVGERLSTTSQGRTTTSRWRVTRPTENATFVLGRFREQSFGSPESLQVVALMLTGKADPVVWQGERVSIVQGAGLQDWAASDVVRTMGFYQRIFGPSQFLNLTVAQIPALEGEAFPGLINIPETPFGGPTAAMEDQVFRSHEVAHQWWGYAVTPRTYHDHWLMEGFANYSGLWYLQSGLGRNRDYLDLLKRWRMDLLDDRKTRPEHGRQAGPIWLGYRNATRDRPYDYALVDYKRGAWVVHMLRSLLLDLDSMDDSRFSALMQDFFRTHSGGTASTEDFRRIAEKHAGQDLGWFFDQWVYRNDVPVYEFATNTVRTPDGQYRVSCRIRQTGVAEGFRMPVTLRAEFGPERFAWVRRMVEGPTSRFDLPLLPLKPTRVVLNDLESVLCEVKEVSW